MRIYLAGPMRGYAEFNFPAFHAAAARLREQGHTVFNPAERDIERHGADISKGNDTGDEQMAAKAHGFDLRVALGEDLARSARTPRRSRCCLAGGTARALAPSERQPSLSVFG